MLCEFFDAMVSSIRLFRLKRLPATLSKLSRNIESLTDRRFTLHHLAQLKHIVPDIIAVKKIRVQDGETGCMKEELLVSVEIDAVETDKSAKGSCGYSHLKRVFHSQIIDYATTHPESDDVPEGELPELFYKPKLELEPSMNQSSVLPGITLAGPSFKRRFSSRTLRDPVSELSSAVPWPEIPIKETAIDTDVMPTIVTLTLSKVNSTPSKCDSTPAKFASTPAKLMSATPVSRTPKRSLTDDGASNLLFKSAKRRALRFEENDDDAEEQQLFLDNDKENDVRVRNSAASKDLLSVLPEKLLHSLMEKEQRILEEQDPIVSQARKRQQLMAGAPKLFDMIQLLFQSIRRTVMTKEELIHKLITGHLDVVNKEEVEEQLKLLLEVAPEFLTEQSSFSGDTHLRINKMSCAVYTSQTSRSHMRLVIGINIIVGPQPQPKP